MSDFDVPDPEELPLELLLRLARREIEDDDDLPMPSLLALHRRPTREVFDRAAALVGDRDATQREWGVRILRELGDEQPGGCRPFHADSDEQVRTMAAAHHEAIREVRTLLSGVFEPGKATGAYDYLIGPVLVTLACAADAADARPWLAG